MNPPTFHLFIPDEASPYHLVAAPHPIFRSHGPSPRVNICRNFTMEVTGAADEEYGKTNHALEECFKRGMTHVYGYSTSPEPDENGIFHLTVSACRVLVPVLAPDAEPPGSLLA
jgi:hypothetical protein